MAWVDSDDPRAQADNGIYRDASGSIHMTIRPGNMPQAAAPATGGRWVDSDSPEAQAAAPPTAPTASIMDRIANGASDIGASDPVQAAKTVGIRGVASGMMWPADIAHLATMGLSKLMGAPMQGPPKEFEKRDISKMSPMELAGYAESLRSQASQYPGTSADVANAAFKLTPEYKAKTEGGRIGMAAGTGAVAALVNAPSILGVLTGATSGAAGQGASDAFPNTWWAGPLASLLAGGATLGTYSALRPSRAGVARDIIEDARNNTGVAGGLQRDARAMQLGPITAPESLNSPYGLSVQRLVEQSREGRGTRGVMQQRGGLASTAADNFIGTVAPGFTPRMGAATVQDSANGAIATQMGQRSAATSPYYQAGIRSGIPQQEIGPLVTHLDDLIQTNGATSEIGRGATELRQRVLGAVDQSGLVRIGPLESAYKEFRDRLTRPGLDASNLSGANSSSNGAMGGAVDRLGTLISNNSPAIAMGRAIHQAETPAVDALSRGLVGDLAQPAPLSKAAQTFINPKNERPHDITHAAAALESERPGSAASLVMQYLKDKLEGAKKAVTGDPSRVGAKFNAETMGAAELNTQQAQNIEAAMRALPNGDQLFTGFRRLTNVFRAQGNRYVPGSPTAYNAAIAEQLADPSGFGKLGQLVVNPPRTIFQSIQNVRLRHTYEALDAVFSSPDSLGALQRLAREPNFRRQQAIVSTFVGGRGMQPSP